MRRKDAETVFTSLVSRKFHPEILEKSLPNPPKSAYLLVGADAAEPMYKI